MESVDGNEGSRTVVMELSHIKQLEEQLGGSPELCKRLASQIFSLAERSIGMITSANLDDGRKRSASDAGLASATPSSPSDVADVPFKTAKKRRMMEKRKQQGLLPVHAPALAGMSSDEAGAAHRRGPDALRRRLPRHPHLRSQGSGSSRPGAGAQPGLAHPSAEPGCKPDGQDRRTGRGHGATGLERHDALLLPVDAGTQPVLYAVYVGELGRVPGDLGLQKRRHLPAARVRCRGRGVAGAVRATRSGVCARDRERAGARSVQPRRVRRHRHFQLPGVILAREGRRERQSSRN